MSYFREFAAATLVAAALVSSGCSSGDPTPPMPPAPVDTSAEPARPSGTIRVLVLLKGDAPKPGTDTITQDQKTCGNEVALPRIVVDPTSKGVENTFVFLEGVPSSGPTPAPVKKTILIDQKNCQYVPHSMIATLGS